MLRVLQVVTHMNRGGLETMLMNYYRHMDRDKVQFDFLTHRPYDGDFGEEIHALGGKIYHLPLLNPFSKAYLSELDRFFKEHPEYIKKHPCDPCYTPNFWHWCCNDRIYISNYRLRCRNTARLICYIYIWKLFTNISCY